MLMLCSTCLSSDRKLVPLNKLKNDISINCEYFMINENITNLICWECQAIFMKIHKFRLQAMKAQEFLVANYCLNNDKFREKTKTTKCMSQLSIHTKRLYDAIWTFIDTTELETTEDTCAENDDEDFRIIIPNNVSFFESVSNITNYALDTNQPICTIDTNIGSIIDSIIDHHNKTPIDTNIGNNIGSNIDQHNNSATVKNEDHISQTMDDEANICPIPENVQVKNLTKDESRFLVTVMTEEEMYQTREIDRNKKRYKIAPYKCVSCIKAFFDENRYQKHVLENHSERVGKHKCNICDVRINRRDALNQHTARHYHKYQCRLCQYQSHRLPTMLIHEQKEQNSKVSYPCNECGKEFLTPRTLRYHKECVHKESTICKLCNRSFSKPAFKSHMLTHNKNKVPCPDCGKLYKEISLRIHRKIHTRVTDESAYCPECHKQYKDQTLYRRHLAKSTKHCGDFTYCDYCNKKFTDKNYLAVHITRIHMHYYKHKCHLCKKGFINKSNLNMHIRVKHEGYERPNDKLCSFCGKGFKDTSVLIHHIRSHTGERPNKCSYCPAAFAQRSAMLTHCRALHPESPLPPPPKRNTTGR